MKAMLSFVAILFIALLFTSCTQEGCTSIHGANYSADNDEEDGSCVLPNKVYVTGAKVTSYPERNFSSDWDDDSTGDYADLKLVVRTASKVVLAESDVLVDEPTGGTLSMSETLLGDIQSATSITFMLVDEDDMPMHTHVQELYMYTISGGASDDNAYPTTIEFEDAGLGYTMQIDLVWK